MDKQTQTQCRCEKASCRCARAVVEQYSCGELNYPASRLVPVLPRPSRTWLREHHPRRRATSAGGAVYILDSIRFFP